jgi:HSP20 family protein
LNYFLQTTINPNNNQINKGDSTMLVRVQRFPIPSFCKPLTSFDSEINTMFDKFMRGGTADDGSSDVSHWMPAADVAEYEDEYQVKVEIPGVSKDDVKITMQENILTIHGEKKQEKESKDSNYHRAERSYGSFQRSFTLPTSVKHDKIEASYNDGILTIALPKAEEAKPRQIEVKVK